MGSQWFLRKVKFQKKQTGDIFMRITQKTPTDSLWEICCFPRNGSFSHFHPDIILRNILRPYPFEMGNATAGQTLLGPHPPWTGGARRDGTWTAECLPDRGHGNRMVLGMPARGLNINLTRALPAMTSLLHVFVGDVWGGHSQDTRWVPTSCKWTKIGRINGPYTWNYDPTCNR